ncbi:MAG: UPF0182 family protein, partial [Cyanobacteriota bacterium]
MRPRPLLFWLGALLLLGAGVVVACRLWVEWHWFEQFGWGSVLLRRFGLQLALALAALALGLLLQRGLAVFWRLGRASGTPRRFPLEPLPYTAALLLLLAAQLLPLLLLLQLAHRLLLQPFDSRRLHGVLLLLDGSWPGRLGLVAALVLAALALLWRPQFAARSLAGTGALAAAVALARGWGVWTLALLTPESGVREPLLGADVSFGLARFPALALLLTIALALLLLHTAAALWGQLARPPQLSDGRFAGFSAGQLLALRLPLGLAALGVAAGFWLGRHQLLFSSSGSVPGAGWVDVHGALPLRSATAALALLTALLVWLPLPRRGWRLRLGGSAAGLLLALPLLEALLLPLVQLLVVTPRELERERPYLKRSIAATRAAFQLDHVRSRDVNPNPRISRADLARSEATIRNIRLWDSQPLLATNRQLQQLRVFYRFSEPSVDRYAIGGPVRPQQQQVIITAREMDISDLQASARTWLNRHLVFTHGQGFTVSPVNTSSPDGLPEYFISDLGSNSRISGSDELGISRDQVKAAIPVGRPSLYYGTLPLPYALVPTRVREFSYPEGDINIYTHYDGDSGVPLAHGLARFAAATYLGEPRLLVEGSLTPQTRLLLRREVRERLRRLAPFVSFEAEPYLVSV